MEEHDRLVESLHNSQHYDHRVGDVTVRETHISTILLTGPYAYKIKKPVTFDFLDFSTLEKRHRYCREELRLNRRLCPDLYREVLPVSGSPSEPVLGEESDVFEYVLKMEQFDDDLLLSHLAERDELTREIVDEISRTVADFHETVDRRPDDGQADPDDLRDAVRGNFQELEEAELTDSQADRLEELRRWSRVNLPALLRTFRERREEGAVRNCHGDMHLGNMVRHDGTVKIFDCIEFNESFRWIDVVDELAFLTMDLKFRGHEELANRVLNDYVTRRGDHEGLRSLNFYRVYRALVRCKVEYLETEDPELSETAERYLETAWSYVNRSASGVLITHGVSGTGKTTRTRELLERHGAVRLRSDVERKRLAGIPFRSEPEGQEKEELYSTEMTERTYEELLDRTGTVVRAGFPVIVDATFLKAHFRERFRQRANELGVPFGILHFDLPDETLKKRLEERERREEAVSDAGVDVLERQREIADPLSEDEATFVLDVTEEGLGEDDHEAVANVLDGTPPQDDW